MQFLLFLIPLAASLNILISSTDSWVSKNPRYLYRALVEKGHKVMYVGPLHAHNKESVEAVGKRDGEPEKRSPGGDFNHLLEALQEYYKSYRKVKHLPRGAKNVLRKKEVEAFDTDFDSQSIVAESFMGQDPLNRDFWYVAGTPFQALSLAFDVILPKYASLFTPDLVIIGPNEGLHLTSRTGSGEFGFLMDDLSIKGDQVEAMTQLAKVHQYSAIAVSVQDEDQIYYEDESLFNIEESKYEDLFKDDPISQTVKFVNEKVSNLIDNLATSMDSYVSLNINFPSLNHEDSKCFTHGSTSPEFVQVANPGSETGAYGTILSVPEVQIKDDTVTFGESQHFKVSEELKEVKQIRLVEKLRMSYLLLNQADEAKKTSRDQHENLEELEALGDCKIAVSVNHINKGNNLGTSILNIAANKQ